MKVEGSNAELEPARRAGFGIRVFAGLIDFIVLLIPFSVAISFVAVGLNVWYSFFFAYRPGQPLPADLAEKGPRLVSIGVGLFIMFSWLYFAFLESSKWRATLGKHWLGLYVGDERGERIGFWRASQRFAAGRLLLHVPLIGAYYFIADCVCIAVVSGNRAIHDILSRCLVLRK
jgi:uncharacterized RDD family membrane protein YckC